MLLIAGVACGDENSGPAAGFEVLRGYFKQREIVELTTTGGGYNPVSRFLEALAVDPESAHT